MSEERQEETEAKYKAELKRLKAYNKSLHEIRETELPPLYEPLLLNCDLLFALADRMQISDSEKNDIEGILQTENNGVFLTRPINDLYSFSERNENDQIEFSTSEISIPACLLTPDATFTVTVSDQGNTTVFDDFVIDEVEREEEALDTFIAHVTSEEMDDYEWTQNAQVKVEIINHHGCEPMTFEFYVAEYSERWVIGDKIVFSEK